MRFASTSVWAPLSLCALLAVGCAGDDADAPTGAPGSVAIDIAPLTLQKAAGASWRLVVESRVGEGYEAVIDRTIGSDGERGSATFVAPCVAGESRATVTLLGVTDEDGAAIDVLIPPPATKPFTCVANGDTPLTFDITVMAAAHQGFFDVSVDYEDVFCSAKIDCSPAFLQDPETGVRGPTLITGLTCTAGPSTSGESTYLGLGQAYLCCANGNRVECTLLEGTPRAGVVTTKKYEGTNEVIDGRFLNTAWLLDTDYLASHASACTFSAMAYVNTAPEGETPATTYVEGHPAFHWYAEIDASASCTTALLDAGYSAVPPNGTADCSPLPDVGPDQPETCNGRDDNCDGQIDEGFVPGVDCVAGVDADCPCVPPDADDDGIPDVVDNCPERANLAQGDIDEDGVGDACDDDMDGDGVANGKDNCPGVANASQADANFDGVGDACVGLGSSCGDGVVQLGEQCDEGIFNSDFNSGACRSNCLWGYCGDAVTDPPEACDDGNDLSGDGCEPTCELAPLGGSTPPQARLLFGTGSGGSGGGSAQSVYNGWESDGFEATAATAAYPVPQACVHETAPGQPIDAKLTSTVFDVSGFDTTATISFTAAVTPSTAKGLNPAVSDGTGGVGSGGAGGGFGGASGTGGAWYGGNGGGGGGYGSGSGSGTGGGYGGYYAGGSSSSGTLAGYTSGNAGVGGGGGAFTGTGYPGSQVTTYVECTYDGGATWHIVEAVPGYWQGSQSFRIPLYDPTVPGAVPGPGFQVRLRCEGTSGDQGFYLGVSDFQLVKGDANVGPSLSPRPSELVLQRGETRVVDFQLSDPDGAPGPLGFLFQGPDFATFQDLGGGLGRLTLAPRADQPYGWYSARLQYSDGAIVGSQWVNLVVPAPPPPPTKCVKIRSAPDGGGVEVGALTLTKGASTTLYAAAYSDAACTAYIGETNVYWRHDGTLPETTVGPFAVYYYTARVAGVAGTITTEHPDPSVVNDVTGTLTLTKAPPGPLDPTRALVAASPAAIPADGATVTTLTVTLTDDRGQTITDAGHTVVFAAPTSGTLLGAVSQNADGTWSQALRAPATVGSATLTATADGQALTASATVLFTENRDTAVLAETTDGKITCADVAGLAGRDLIVSTPITVDIDPAVAGCEAQLLYLQNLTVKPTGSLTHTATATTAGTPERVLNLSVANLTIESASASVYGKIDVTGRGYGVNRTFDNSGTGATTTTYQAGSHGGLGGKAPATAFVYDDFRDPRRPGAGSSAVAGGGVVRIAVRSGGAARVDGKILADGSPGTAGGAGGTIALSTPSLTGSGSLSAQGGAATNTNGGGGGGGRIALTGMASASGAFAPEAFGDAVLACGGADTNTSLDQAGGAGSVWFQTTSGSAQGGILVYDACGRIGADRSTPMNVLPQGTYSALTATQVSTTSVPTSAPSRFVGSTVALTPLSTFDGLFDEPAATVTGFGSILLDRDLTARAAASGTYRALTTVGVLQVKNGARVDAVGDLYVLAGSLADPATFALDGTLEAKRLDLGNANAITVRGKGDLRVTEQIISRNQANFRFPYTIDGGKVTVSVAGMPLGSVTVYNGGSLAGSGGVVHGDAVFDAPNFTANPISGFSFLADLLIKNGTFSADDVSVGGDLSVFGGGFVARYARVGGDVLFDAGATLTLKGTTNGEGLRGLVADGDIVAQGQSAGGVATKLSHQRPNNDSGNVSGSPSALYLAADNVRVVAPAIIDVSGKGWNGPYGPINNTAYIAQSDEGGSHGGRGAATVAANRPLAYDSATAPTLPGAGGYTSGHYGGGAAIVVATTSIALSSVDANASLTGGGAGGTISLRAGESIRVDGTLTARGGNGNGQNRAGGGGRIAVVAGGSLLGALATDPRAATDASGGVYGATTVTSGGAGTIWLDDGFSLPTLMVDNRPDVGGNPRSGSQATIADGTPYPFQGVGAMSALGAGVSPTVPAEFTATPSFETAPLALGQSFLVLPDDVVRRVVGVESGTGAWLLDAPATGLTGAGHTWCALLDLAHLDVLGNAQLQHNGCVRVAGSNVGDGTPTSWDLDGGVNVARLDLGAVTSVALTGPVARFDAGAQLGAGGVLAYPFTATLSGRLSAASLLLGALTATTSETTRPTIDVAGAASLASFTVTGSPQPVELKAGSVTVGDALDQTGGYITAGDVLVKGRTALSGVAVDLTGAWTVTAEASGATGAFSQAGGSFAADALSAAGPVSFTGTPVTLIGHGEGVVSLASITLSGAATVVSHVLHDASLTDRRALRLTAPVVEFLAGASIDVAGRGFRGATNNGYAPLAALRATSSGGSHGGMGASTSLASRAKTYDDLYAPTLAGGGGSYANAHGGGAVIIAATTRATLGAIDASGISGASNYGGGAGGAINVSAPEIVVNGLLSVRGGNSLNTSYLGGGGGMIALLAGSTLTNNVGARPWDMVVLRGGSYSSTYTAGSGTLFTKVGAADGDLLLDNAGVGGTQTDSTPLPFQWFGASPSAPTAAQYALSAAPAWPPSGYRVDPNVAQPLGAPTPSLDDDATAVVGEHAAATATLPIASGDPSVGWTAGAVGCAYYRFDHLTIRGNAQLTLDGCLRVDDGAYAAADPAVFPVEGGLNVTLIDLNGVDEVAVSGASGRVDLGTQVGHGVSDYPFDLTITGPFTSTTGLTTGDLTASSTSVTVTGDVDVAGALALSNVTLAANAIDVAGTATLIGGASTVDGITAGDDLRFEDGQVVTVRGQGSGLVSTGGDVVFTGASTRGTHSATPSSHGAQRRLYVEGTDVTVANGASLDVSGRGYPAGIGPTSALAASGNKGGSHGGRGAFGATQLASRVDAYDDPTAPTWAGGGGGGSTGGGVLRVVARNDAAIDTARANANATGSGTPTNSAGGAGGAVWVSAVNTLAVGVVEAFGGNGYTASYAGGGGGRVALEAGAFGGALAGATYDAAFDAALDVHGGGTFSGGAAGAGTAFLRSANRYPQGALIIDNENATPATQRDSTPLRGARGTVAGFGDAYVTLASAAPLGLWTAVGWQLTVDADEGTASLGDNTIFTVTGQSGTRLDLDADPSSLAPTGKTWALIYVLDHLEVSGNAQVDAGDALVRVTGGSLASGVPAEWRVDGGFADPALETEGAAAGLVLDVAATTDLVVGGVAPRFDVGTQVLGGVAGAPWRHAQTAGVVELDRLRVQRLDAGDITGSLVDVRALEAVEDLTLTNVSFEATGYGAGLVAGASATLTLAGTSTALHQAHDATGDARALRLAAGTVRVESGAKIDVSRRGFAATQAPTASAAAGANEGGSHCGRGYAASLSARAPAYDDVFAPTLAGGGGGDGGAYGGGVVRIDAATLVDVAGQVLADGQGSSTTGAAGGAIWISAPTIALDGTTGLIAARGGDTANSSYEPGGGGCVALEAATAFAGAPLTGTAPWANLDASGGDQGTIAGGAGTISLRAGGADGDLLVDNKGATGTQDDSTELPWLPVGTITAATGQTLTVSGATLTGPRPNSRQTIRLVATGETPGLGDETLRAVTATAASTLTLDGDAAPFAGQAYASYYRFDRLAIRGNAHLLTGAHVRVDEADFTPPATTWALGGGLVAPYLDLAGVTDLTFTGPNSRFDVPKDADGTTLDPAWNPVGWSGTLRLPELATTSLTASGMALKDVHRLHVTGDLVLTGTSCDDHALTAGSPGCDLIEVTNDVTWTGGVVEAEAIRAGHDMTLTDTQIELHGYATGLPGGVPDGLSAGNALTLAGATFTLTHDAVPATGTVYRANVEAGGDLTLADGATITVSGRGYRGNAAPAASLVGALSVGGSHLGLGGAASPYTARKPTYDAYWAPSLPGAGGGGTANGGAGGGVVRLHAGHDLTLAGDVLANGGAGSNAAGGAGGAILATADHALDLAVTADLAANGGNGAGTGNYAGGGGGIALIAPTLAGEAAGDAPWDRAKAMGGLGGDYAGAGTLFLMSTARDSWGHLVVDNGGQVTTQVDSTPVVFQGQGSWAASGVAYSAGAGATTLTSTTGGFTATLAPVGFLVNPRVGQPVGAVTATLGDDAVFPVASATASALVVTGDASGVAAGGDTYIPHYRFDTLTVRGNAQLAGDAEIYVDAGNWHGAATQFAAGGGVHVTALDLNDVTALSLTGPQSRLEVTRLVGQGTNAPRFDLAYGGSASVGDLRVNALAAASGTLTVKGTLDVLGDLSLSGTAILAGSGDVVVSGAVTFSGVTVDMPGGSLTADSVALVGGSTRTGDLVVTHALVGTQSADLRVDTCVADSASFDGPEGDVWFRLMDVDHDVAFSGGTRFEETGVEGDADAPDGLFAGGTVLLTGSGGPNDPTAGTHSQHGKVLGEQRVLRVEADVVRVADGAVLDVDGKGYPGDAGGTGYAPSNALRASQRQGGSHVGINVNDSYTNRRSYDDIFRPTWAGASGGGGYYTYSCVNCCWNGYYYSTCTRTVTNPGGAGGGAIHVVAASLIDLDGPVEARGLDATYAPGGAGGAITLEAPVVRLVNGALQVSGGAGTYINTGQSSLGSREQYGGGGGAAAVIASDRVEGVLLDPTLTGVAEVRGGAMSVSTSTYASGAGTLFLDVAGVRTLLVDNAGQTLASNLTPLPFSGGSTVNGAPTATTFASASQSTYGNWSPVGYAVNPNTTQSGSLAGVTYFPIAAVNGSVFTLETDGIDLATVTSSGKAWRPFYDLDRLEVRGNAGVYVDGQVLVREGSLTPVGTAGTTSQGSPGQIAVAGSLSVAGTLEVLAPVAPIGITGARTEADPGRFADESVAKRCDEYLRPAVPGYAYTGSTGDGVYRVDPDGSGPIEALLVYCDMTSDGGGWTKVESATWPHFFSLGDWQGLNAATPLAENYSILAHRAAFVGDGGCYTYRFAVGDGELEDWTAAPSHTTAWQQCHDPFTAATDGSDYSLVAGEQSVTCGGFNGLHNGYQGVSMATDVDSGDSINCWFMQVVPTGQYVDGAHDPIRYLDGYGVATFDRRWQSLWLRAGGLAMTPSAFAINPGASRALTASGGKAPYVFSAISVAGGSVAGSTYTAPAAPGIYLVRVTDASGAHADATVTVVSQLSLSPSPVTLSASQTQLFTASGGAAPYTYTVVSGGGSFAGATFTPPASAGAAVVRVTDALGNVAEADVTVYVPTCSNGSTTNCNVGGTTLIASSAYVDPAPPSGWSQCAGFLNTSGDDVTDTFANNCLGATRLRVRAWDASGVLVDDLYLVGIGTFTGWPSRAYINGTSISTVVTTNWTTSIYFTSTNGQDACAQASASSGVTIGTGNSGRAIIAGANTNGLEYRINCGGSQLLDYKVALYR